MSLPASELIGRVVINSHGADFVVVDLELDARTGEIIIELDDIDPDTGHPMDTPNGVRDLKGWTIANKLHCHH